MPLTKQQFLEMEGNINMVWNGYHKSKKDYIGEFFNVIKKNTSQFTDLTMGTAGRMQPWDGSVAYDTIGKGYEKQYKPTKYSTGIKIERDMWEDKEYERIAKRVKEVAYGVHKTMYYESAEIFNKFTSSEIVGADGQPLGSASHKITPDADAQSNLFTNELTYDGLEATNLSAEAWQDDRGDQMDIYLDFVIAGPRQRDNCKKLFGSDKEAFVGDNTKNIYKDHGFIIHPLITGDKWFYVNKDMMKDGTGFNFFLRRDPRKLERDKNLDQGDFDTEVLSWKSVGRWTKGWTNWFFIACNNI